MSVRFYHDIRSELGTNPLQRRFGRSRIAPTRVEQVSLLATQRRRDQHSEAHRAHGRGEWPAREESATALEQRSGTREWARQTDFARHCVRLCRGQRSAFVIQRERDRETRDRARLGNQLAHETLHTRPHEK